MGKQNLVFYCKGGCGVIVMAAINKPEILADIADEIAEELKFGSIIDFATDDEVRSKFATCKCHLTKQMHVAGQPRLV